MSNYRYQVIVGNIGTVENTNDVKQANETYYEFVNQSKNNYGRAAGEDVTMLEGDEISKEYFGTISQNEQD